MARAAGAGRAVVELAGTCAHRPQEVGKGFPIHRRMGGEHIGRVHRERDRREVSLGIERGLLEEKGIDQQGIIPHQQRMAVGVRLRHHAGTDIAAAAGTIVDDHPLGPALAEPLRQDAGEGVEAATGCRRHHDPHRPRRIILRRARRSCEQRHAGPRVPSPNDQCGCVAAAVHDCSLTSLLCKTAAQVLGPSALGCRPRHDSPPPARLELDMQKLGTRDHGRPAAQVLL